MRRETQATPLQGENLSDQSIRPRHLDEFIGQEALVSNLKVYVQAALGRGECLDHILLSGMPGLGKTTLAQLVAECMDAPFHSSSGPVLERARDMVGLLSNLEAGAVLFIDEIHRLQPTVEEFLYSALEDYYIDIVLDQGPNARSMKIQLPPFTLVAATTREGSLTSPLRARFGIHEKLECYPESELQQILIRSAGIIGARLTQEGAIELSKRCRGTPRIANRYLRRVRDFAEVQNLKEIDAETAIESLARLGVDPQGLDALDRKILGVVAKSEGTPVGVKTISVSVGEDERTIEEVYEPFLIRNGYLVKTPRGRVLGHKISEISGFGE